MPAKSKPPHSPSEIYDVLIRLQQLCFDAGSVEASYHVPAAAMHAAEDAGKPEGIQAVIAIAEHRQRELDSAEPAAPLSADEAKIRGTLPLFATLARTANAVLTRLQTARTVSERQARRHPSEPSETP
jgi:hypothetical protein